MILNTFCSGIHVTPHSSKDLAVGVISKRLINEIRDFIEFSRTLILQCVDVCNNNPMDFFRRKKLDKLHKKLYDNLLQEHGVSDKTRLKSYPAEYVEAIYILTFLLWDDFKITQEQTADFLDTKGKDYNEKMGINPIMDCRYFNAKPEALLSFDQEEYTRFLLVNIGKLISTVSCKYVVGVTNKASVIRNLPSPKRGHCLYNSDIYAHMFYFILFNNYKELKEMVLNLLSLDTVELEEDFIHSIIREDIVPERKNLRCQNKEAFMEKWRRLKGLFVSIDYYSNIIDNPEEHEEDEINYSGELCDGLSLIEYAEIEKEKRLREYEVIKVYIQEGLTMESLGLKGRLRLINHLNKKYVEDLSNSSNETFDPIQLAAKYFITKYFEGGESDERYKKLLEEVESKQFRIFSRVQVDLRWLETDISKIAEEMNDHMKQINRSVDSRKKIFYSVLLVDYNAYNISDSETDDISQLEYVKLIVWSDQECDFQHLYPLKDRHKDIFIYSNIEME